MIKDLYFTPGTIEKKSTQMMENLSRLGLIHTKKNIDFSKTALLVLDMQNYFLKKESHAFIPSAPAIITGIKKLIDIFTNQKLQIIYTRHINMQETARGMGFWWKELIDKNSPMSLIIKEINLKIGEVILKERYDAFWNTQLDELLNKKNIQQVIITGVMTHLCCETTARSAFMRDYQVLFAVDGTATYLEDMHVASLLNLSHGFAIPTLISEIIADSKCQI